MINNWRAGLVVAAQDGMLQTQSCGGVRCGQISVKLEMRLPPTLPIEGASAKFSELLTSDPPHRAEVTFEQTGALPGWYQERLHSWIQSSLD
jgi:hypothetical protein